MNSKMKWIIVLLIHLHVLHLDLKRQCDAHVYGVARDINSVLGYGKQFKKKSCSPVWATSLLTPFPPNFFF